MAHNTRHVDSGQWLSSFSDEVWVSCVRCGAPGVVHATWAPYRWTATYQCRHCPLALTSDASDWLGPVQARGRRSCGHCGHKWLTPSAQYDTPPQTPPTELPATCTECGRQTLVHVDMYRVLPADHACDPHFGLPLRLTTPTRHGTVWAYNPRHVAELSAYVNAKLRERQNTPHKGMFSRLPQWMKLAKHRAEIAKALTKLRERVPAPPNQTTARGLRRP